MKILIVFVILIDYINGRGFNYNYYETTSTPSWEWQRFSEYTTTDSYTSSKLSTKILPTPTGNCEQTENNIALNLSSTGLQRINERFINNSRIICLDLSNNNIISVSPEALELLPNLTYLNLANNQIRLSEFTLSIINYKLKTLILDNNEVNQNLAVSLQDFFPNVEHIYIRKNNLIGFSEANIFLNVRHLYLSDNNIASAYNIFGETPHTKLTHLYLERNSLRSFNGTTLYNLKYLALDGNRIENLCNQYCHHSWLSLNNMTKLKHLSLSGNQISEIESDSFVETSNLINLDLSDNKITTIRRDTLRPLTMLQVLSLSGNQFITLPDFSPLSNIQQLNLDRNNLLRIPAGTFSNFSVLKNLSLSDNKISNVEKHAFFNLISLEELYLSNNKIENLPEEWMSPQSRLRILSVKDNGFTNFKNLSLENAESLEHLFLERNAIEILNVAYFSNLSEYVSIHIENQSKKASFMKKQKQLSAINKDLTTYEYNSERSRFSDDEYM